LGVTYYKSIATSAIHPATPFWVFKGSRAWTGECFGGENPKKILSGFVHPKSRAPISRIRIDAKSPTKNLGFSPSSQY
jgi:hypothetical protein